MNTDPPAERPAFIRANAAVVILHRLFDKMPSEKAAADLVRDYVDEQMKDLNPTERGLVRAFSMSLNKVEVDPLAPISRPGKPAG